MEAETVESNVGTLQEQINDGEDSMDDTERD